MAKVKLQAYTGPNQFFDVAPWGQQITVNDDIECSDPVKLEYFKSSRRYTVIEDAPPPEPTPAPAPAPEPAEEADLSVLDLSIGNLEDELATGDHDDQLDALLAAEEAGKTRKGAVSALKARMESL